MRRRFKNQNMLTYPINFLSHPKIAYGPIMILTDLEPENVPQWLFFKFRCTCTSEKPIEFRF